MEKTALCRPGAEEELFHPDPGDAVKFSTGELRSVALFEGLPDWQLAWLGEHGDRIDLATGQHMFEEGQPADFMFVVVRGTIQRFENIGGASLVVATTRQGEVTGMLPYSRMTHYPGCTVATEPSQLLRIRKSDFPEMLSVSQEMGQRLVAVMSDRVRGDVRLEQQQERMVALGRLSAGLAHELNNPAAAIRRAAAALADQFGQVTTSMLSLIRHPIDEAGVRAIEELRRDLGTRPPRNLAPVERSRLEEDLTSWLEAHHVPDAWKLAGLYIDTPVRIEDLEGVANRIPDAVLGDALTWIGGGLSADRIAAEIASSGGRISELIGAVKVYSHMDRSSQHAPTDVREGLENTLIMLGHRLKEKGIHLERRYQEDLPRVSGNAGELNQVWTNLIDNALDALPEGGELRIDARTEESALSVKVIDNGHGIPDEIRSHVFDPFFTTKSVGEGTGLGLDIAMRIIKTHRGGIDIESRPGRTVVRVRLPLIS